MSNKLSKILVGQTALVTGASKGIGRAIAERLSQYKMKLGLLGRSTERLEEVAAVARENGSEPLGLTVDLTKRKEVEHVVLQFKDAFGAPSILINNAGIGDRRYWMDHSIDNDLDMMAVNYSAPILLTRLLLPDMLKNKFGGRIININSMAGLYTSPYTGAYCASKAALLAYFTSLAHEMKSTPVTISSIFMGPVDTDFISQPGFECFKNKRSMLKPADMAEKVMNTIQYPKERVFVGSLTEFLATKIVGLNPVFFRGAIESRNPPPLKLKD